MRIIVAARAQLEDQIAALEDHRASSRVLDARIEALRSGAPLR